MQKYGDAFSKSSSIYQAISTFLLGQHFKMFDYLLVYVLLVVALQMCSGDPGVYQYFEERANDTLK